LVCCRNTRYSGQTSVEEPTLLRCAACPAETEQVAFKLVESLRSQFPREAWVPSTQLALVVETR
jgi:hypothetical protein